MNLDDLAVFVEAVQTGSLAAAARKLSLTPMAASRRLSALEQDLGVRLLHRTTRALSLTTDGETFLPHAQTLLDAEANSRAALSPLAQEASGLLRVTASIPFGRKIINTMMATFLRENPQIRVELLLTDSLVDLVAEGQDLAIRIAPLRDSSLIARKLKASPRTLFAAPGYLAAHGTPRRMADLADHQCLCTTGRTHWSFRGPTGVIRQRIQGRLTANSLETLHQASREGLGIVNLANWNAQDDVRAGRLAPIHLEDGAPEDLNIWAVYPTAHMVPLKVRRFIDALQRTLTHRDQGPAPDINDLSWKQNREQG